MRRLLLGLGKWATKIESWWALVLLLMSTGLFSWLGKQWGLLASQGLAGVIIVALMCSSVLAIGVCLTYFAVSKFRERHTSVTVREIASPSEKQDGQALEIIENIDFTRKTVSIDGRHFINCTFDNTLIHYQGGRYRFSNCKIREAQMKLLTNDQTMKRLITLQRHFGVLQAEVDHLPVGSPK